MSSITALSNDELKLVSDANVLLTKNRIIQKVYELFGQVAEAYEEEYGKFSFVETAHAKISKGENYEGLPYVMLDYPRVFSKEKVFAVRSFFWWGNFFSITLQLSGAYFYRYWPVLKARGSRLSDWFVSVADDPWMHHFEESNYLPWKDINEDRGGNGFIKLAKKIPLQEWDQSFEFFIENFSLLLALLSADAME